ncbi:ammonia channel protein, partial [Sphingomonas sp. PsM26]|nr:ammonia channel protein [Sphingomonas sp. PsM26]
KDHVAAQMEKMVKMGVRCWLLISGALVLMMSVGGLGVFLGGVVRTKIMVSVLLQVMLLVCVAALVWVS